MAEIRRTLAAAVPLLVAALAVIWLRPSALGDDALVWQKTEWHFHPPEGFAATEKHGHDEVVPLVNGWLAMVGRLESTGEGFVQLHDEDGRWLWTTLLPDEDVDYWSEPAAVAVRSSSGAWDLVVSEDDSHYVWRLDAQGKRLWRRRLNTDIGIVSTRAMAAEDGTVWLGGWAETDDFECGDGAGVVKLDDDGNAVWRWRQPGGIFSAADDLLPLGDGRLLVLMDIDVACTRNLESELVLLDSGGEEVARQRLPFNPGMRAMIRLADGRIALLVPRDHTSAVNRLFIVSIDEQTSAFAITEVELDKEFLTGDDFYFLPVAADRDGGLVFFVGYGLEFLAPTGRIARTEYVPPEDWRPCWVQPSKVLCLDQYLLRWIQIP